MAYCVMAWHVEAASWVLGGGGREEREFFVGLDCEEDVALEFLEGLDFWRAVFHCLYFFCAVLYRLLLYALLCYMML